VPWNVLRAPDFSRLISIGLFFAPVVDSPTLAADGEFSIESADTKVALIELYTSEGCSSCPSAEAWLGALKDNPGLWKQFVPVAFHVDYWNHLGWTDRFALPEFTRRQHAYAAHWNASTIYTPAFVLNGEEWRPRRPLPVPGNQTPGRLRVSGKDGGRLEVSFVTLREWHEPLIVEIVPLANGLRTDVRRGENAGRELRHEFVALALVAGDLRRAPNGAYTAQLVLPSSMAAPVAAIAAWVRSAHSPAPIQVAGGSIR
jgi:hypothetical protein